MFGKKSNSTNHPVDILYSDYKEYENFHFITCVGFIYIFWSLLSGVGLIYEIFFGVIDLIGILVFSFFLLIDFFIFFIGFVLFMDNYEKVRFFEKSYTDLKKSHDFDMKVKYLNVLFIECIVVHLLIIFLVSSLSIIF